MEEAGDALTDPPTLGSLEVAARCLAAMQIKTAHCTKGLLEAGASDQRLATLRDHIEEISEYLVGAMERQTSSKVAPLAKERLIELGHILRDCCDRMDALAIPDTLLHNDLNVGNILYDGRRCVFTDWSEAAIGNPFISFERLCLLGNAYRASLRQVYRVSWRQQLNDKSIDDAFILMPLLAIFAYLYGRGDWLNNEQARPPHFESYTRSLAPSYGPCCSQPTFLGGAMPSRIDASVYQLEAFFW